MSTAGPWMKFYPSDWRADQSLRVCSLAARGLWVECMCIMHEASPYGHLTLNGRAVTNAQLAALAGTSSEQISDLLGELEAAGVFSQTREGVIYSRRMTRDQKKARTAENNGKKGGNPTLCKTTGNSALDNLLDKGGDKPQKPEARSQIEEKEEANASSKKSGAVAVLRGHRLPANTILPEPWRQFAENEGLPDPEREWQKFTDYWSAQSGQKGVKADWSATWRNWIRKAVDDGKRARNNGSGNVGRIGKPNQGATDLLLAAIGR